MSASKNVFLKCCSCCCCCLFSQHLELRSFVCFYTFVRYNFPRVFHLYMESNLVTYPFLSGCCCCCCFNPRVTGDTMNGWMDMRRVRSYISGVTFYDYIPLYREGYMNSVVYWTLLTIIPCVQMMMMMMMTEPSFCGFHTHKGGSPTPSSSTSTLRGNSCVLHSCAVGGLIDSR